MVKKKKKKAKWKPLELLLPQEIVNQQQYHIPTRIAEMSATVKVLKDGEVLIPTYPMPIQLTSLAYEEDKWILENDSGFS